MTLPIGIPCASTGAPTSMNVLPSNPHAVVVSVNLAASTVYRQSGAVVTTADLLVGSKVDVWAVGTPAVATSVRIIAPRPVEVNGTITSLTPSTGTPTSITVLASHHHAVAVSVNLAASTIYRQGGAIVTTADLMVGSKVEIVAHGSPLVATSVRIAVPQPINIEGTVSTLNPSTGTPTSMIVAPNGHFKTPLTVSLSAGTIYHQSHAVVTVADLLVGSKVDVVATGNPLTAKSVTIAAPLPVVTLGSVTAVTNTSLTVQPQSTGSKPVVFTLNAATEYFAGREVSTIAEVNVGDVVSITAAGATPTIAASVLVRNMVIIGRVTNVTGNAISVTGFYGAPLTINVTAATNYRLADRTSSLSAVLPGDLVVALGPAISGVTSSVTATTLWIGTKDNSIFTHAWLQHQERNQRHHY